MRTYSRLSTDEVVTLTVDGRTYDAHLYNLSCGGCMVEVDADQIVKGKIVDVQLADEVEMRGDIAWRMGKNAGVRFSVPLHSRVVESFGFDRAAEFEEDEPMDRFGLPLDVGNSSSAGSRD